MSKTIKKPSTGTASKIINLSGLLTTLLLLAMVGCVAPGAQAAQTDIAGPAGSGQFGKTVTVLPNGNIVVTDPIYSIPAGASQVGAVYLYDGTTLAPISTLTGSTADDTIGLNGITVLANGNFVVNSSFWNARRGAVTFCSATAGCAGTVSSANSLVGSTANDQVGSGITALTNGNYVVRSEIWDNGGIVDAGAVTWGSGASGVSGAVSSANSLVGSTANDQVGGSGITALANGNYVVDSSNWDNGAIVDAGAATWGNGTTGTTGAVSSANSLVGSKVRDFGNNRVTPLTNGNYVVINPGWDNGTIADAGAVTWASGAGGISGAVTAANSLVGSKEADFVGNMGVTVLTNSNYIVRSEIWDNGAMADAGAVTWGSGTSGVSGIISAGNSLVGTSANDIVGLQGVTALANGNYVVISPYWDNGAIANAGAVTWGSGTAGTSGTVSSANSLVGSTAGDNVGIQGVTALTNGNYVVDSINWDNPSPAAVDVGAATWGNGTTGTAGTISSANSLVGSTANDQVGGSGITALANGNYVVGSANWDNGAIANAGAATWGSGTTGTSGTVSSASSLVGSTANDNIGTGIRALTNGNYVALSTNWDNPSPATGNVGAVTWGNGTTGISGAVSSANSLVGSTAGDQVGGEVSVLTNGNYVVLSPNWDNPSPVTGNAGAVTWGSGAGGVSGAVSSANSLVGSTLNDQIGNGLSALSNGNYVLVNSTWHNGAISNAGAYTFGNGATGTAGAITPGATGGNSVVGTKASGVNTFAFDPTRNRLFVGRSASNTVSVLFFNTTATSDGAITSAATFDNGLPNGLVNAIIPNGRTVSLSGVSQIGQVLVDCTATLTGASAASYIAGSVRRNYCGTANDSFVYPIGDAGSYSPLTASNVSGTGALTVSVIADTLPGLPRAQSASRYWQLDGAGLTANLTFQYTAGDVSGTESTYKVNRRVGTNNVSFPTTIDTAQHTATVSNVTNFSPWGIGNSPAALAPTAAGVSISGRAKTADGRGLTNAVVMLTTEDGRTVPARTSTFGAFHFEGLKAGQTVILSVEAKRYVFATQLISLTADLSDLQLTASN